MFPRFLLLLSILGPGNGLQFLDTMEHRTKGASGPVHLRERRQADHLYDDLEYDYIIENTDAPEILVNVTNTVAAHPEPLTTMAMLTQKVSGTSESQVTITGTAGTDAGGLAVPILSTDSAAQLKPTTAKMIIQTAATQAETSHPAPKEAETSQPIPKEAGTSQPAATQTETSQPANTESETSQPANTESETSHPEAMEAETSQPIPKEAETSQPASTASETSHPEAMEAETSQPIPKEAETSQPASTASETSHPEAMEAETSQPIPKEAETSQPEATEAEATQLFKSQVVKSQFAESTTTEAPSTETMSVSAETMSTEPTDSPIFLGPSATHKDSDVATGHSNDNSLKNGLFVTPRSSLATMTPGISDLIPVKQCLLAILILASLATIFLVCTVVLAVRLSRKNHSYPVRNYSPTEMICISSLLPEKGEGAPVTANGDLPKVQDLKTEPIEDRDGDDLTLRSFLP